MRNYKKAVGSFFFALTLFLLSGLVIFAQDTATTNLNQQQTNASTETTTTTEGTVDSSEKPINESTINKKLLDYVYLDEKVLHPNDTQNIVFGFKDTDLKLKSATLNYISTTTGVSYSLDAENIIDNTVLFTKTFGPDEKDSNYQLDSIRYQLVDSDEMLEIKLSDEAITAEFMFTAQENSNNQATDEDKVEVTAYALDGSGNTISETGDSPEEVVSQVLEATGETATTVPQSSKAKAAIAKKIIAVNAGHSKQYTGAFANGLAEHELTLQVAQACKAELETYQNVSVYMVRPTADTPNNAPDPISDIRARIDAAVKAGASVYLDLHFNAGGGSGAEVYYPNQSVDPSIGAEGKVLAEKIVNQLAALGLANRGAKYKDSTINERDDQGRLLDYYTTQVYAKQKGIPGLIIEHAFLDSASDAAKLKNPSFVQSLGVADATAVAQTYSLSKESIAVSAYITNVDQNKGTFDVIANSIVAPSGVKEVQIPVWSTANQSNIFWYTATKQSDGTYKATVNIANHGYASGTYTAHVYVTSNAGAVGSTSAGTQVINPQETKLSLVNDKDTIITTTAKVSSNISNIKNIQFATWSAAGGGSDLLWYSASLNADGTWKATIPIINHKNAGKYFSDAYAVLTNGQKIYLGTLTFDIALPNISANVGEYDSNKDGFLVTVQPLLSLSGTKEVKVPVWSDPNQKDLVWYTATKQADGTYQVFVERKNHYSNLFGSTFYYVHVYATSNNGVVSAFNAGGTYITMQSPVLSATNVNNTDQIYNLKLSSLSANSDVKKVEIAVWNKNNNQKDLLWYSGTKGVDGSWSANVNISNHKLSGTYYADAYAVLSNNQKVYLSTTQFYVLDINFNASVGLYDSAKDGFLVTVDNVFSPSGVKEVQVPVWSTSNQSDLVWYTATKQSNGSYQVFVDRKNHNNNIGNYTAHVYITANNGVVASRSAGICQVAYPKVVLTSTNLNFTDQIIKLQTNSLNNSINLQKMEIAVWNSTNNQKDLMRYTATKQGDGTWISNVNVSNHKVSGLYYADVYGTLSSGQKIYLTTGLFEVSPIIFKTSIGNVDPQTGVFDVRVTDIFSNSGVKQIQIPVWSTSDQSNIFWYTATLQSDGSYLATVKPQNHKFLSGTYNVHVYVTGNNGVENSISAGTVIVNETKTQIMGTSSVTANDLVTYYQNNSSISYPSTDLGKGGAATLYTFCQMYIDEATVEGIRPEIAFSQAMLETGFLKYGGDVKINQFNFAGLGATGGVPGNSFSDVRTGIRAHIQHLKCYASTEPLKQAKVDPRWSDSLRGKAPYVEWLSIPNNPNGTGWATDPNYAAKILAGVNKILTK